MKILHTIYDDPSNPWLGGGGAFRTFEISKRLTDKHDITILCGRYPGSVADETLDGVHIRRVGSSQSYPISRLTYSLLASRIVEQSDADLWVYSFSAFAPLMVSKSRRQGSLLECFHVMQDHASEKRGWLGHVAAVIERKTIIAYDRILSISPSVQREIGTIRGSLDGIDLVYTGVDDACFIEDTDERDYILYFGRLDTYTKGLDLLIEAYARILPDIGDIRLIIAGRGTPDKVAELERLATQHGVEDRIELTGPVDTETRTDLYRGSLFNVTPSRYEGWCIAAVEASAAGKAVVGTRIPGLQDAVQHGKTGLLVESGNVDQIAEAMRSLTSDSALRHELGTGGREWASQFRWDRIAQAQDRVYEETLRSQPGVQ